MTSSSVHGCSCLREIALCVTGRERRGERGRERRGERGREERGERGGEERGERGREGRGERGGEESEGEARKTEWEGREAVMGRKRKWRKGKAGERGTAYKGGHLQGDS